MPDPLELTTEPNAESQQLASERSSESPEAAAGNDDEDEIDRPAENPSVQRCIDAWVRTYDKAKAAGEEDIAAWEAGRKAYLRNLPPLAGFENISDFIACVTYLQCDDSIDYNKAVELLASAKVALALVRHQARLAPRRGPGRPRKSPQPAGEEK